jgi:hypothetical protein
VWPGGESPAPDQASLTPTPVATPAPAGTATAASAPTGVRSGPEVRHDLTVLDRLAKQIGAHLAADEAVEAELLQAFTQTTASLADQIETSPDSIAWPDVVSFIQAAADGRALLAAARVDSGAESALSAARAAAQDGVQVASEYFVQRSVETSNGRSGGGSRTGPRP